MIKSKNSSSSSLTRILPALVPLDEADDEQDEDEQSDGRHQTDEPALSGDVHLRTHYR